jgi:DNA topoisomerase-3
VLFRKNILPVYEFTNPPFPKAPHAQTVTHKVSSVAGHVFSVDFPQKYQSWESVDPLELFQAPVMRKPCKGSVVRHLQDECKGANFIVLWMDCDRYI